MPPPGHSSALQATRGHPTGTRCWLCRARLASGLSTDQASKQRHLSATHPSQLGGGPGVYVQFGIAGPRSPPFRNTEKNIARFIRRQTLSRPASQARNNAHKTLLGILNSETARINALQYL